MLKGLKLADGTFAGLLVAETVGFRETVRLCFHRMKVLGKGVRLLVEEIVDTKEGSTLAAAGLSSLLRDDKTVGATVQAEGVTGRAEESVTVGASVVVMWALFRGLE